MLDYHFRDCIRHVIFSSWIHNNLEVALIGEKVDLTYTYEVFCFWVLSTSYYFTVYLVT